MLSLASISMRGLTGHWTKYGGNMLDVFESQHSKFDHWYCQGCSREMTSEVTPYFLEFPVGEYVKVCAICVNDGIIIFKTKIIKIEKNY